MGSSRPEARTSLLTFVTVQLQSLEQDGEHQDTGTDQLEPEGNARQRGNYSELSQDSGDDENKEK